MNTEKIIMLHKQHSEGKSKYTYFLLAVSASAVAFSIQKTTGSSYSWCQLPLGGAILFWGLSFYFGCRNLEWVQTAIGNNLNLFFLHSGTTDNQPETQEEIDAAISDIKIEMKSSINKATACSKKQFNYLIIGAVLFIAWHLLEMYKTTSI